ncbi:MAG: cysteine desulfurase family protein [Sandaracinaceae bacterium]
MSPPRRVYLDHHAAAPLAPGVTEAVGEAVRAAWGNAYSAHAEGRAARALLEHARGRVAEALGAPPADVVLTGGGTEACNLGVFGQARAGAEGPDGEALTVLVSPLEHPAVARSVEALGAQGAQVVVQALHERDGIETWVGLAEKARAAGRRVLWVAQAVNHETGTMHDVLALARRLPWARGFVDASQALGRLPLGGWAEAGFAIAISGAKIGATAGSGALYVPRGVDLAPVHVGGGQERGRRAGTPDVVAHAALGAACAQLEARLRAAEQVRALRDELEARLVARGAVVNGGAGPRVGSVTNVSVPGWRSATLVAALDLEGVAASAGAACSSGVDAPSAVVASLHPDEPWRARSCLRLSLGPETTRDDVGHALAAIERVLARRPA